MIRIFVLEDQDTGRKALEQFICTANGREEIVVDSAASLEEGRKYVESNTTYAAFFLDINLDLDNPDDESGIELAKLIRAQSRYEFTPLIMVTSIARLEITAYRELHCYQYLLKPYIEEDVKKLVNKLLATSRTSEEKSIVVKKDGINYRIKCDAIVYVQAIPRGVCLFLKKETMKIPYLTIVKLMEQLPQDDFIQCHRMCVFNKKYVENVDFVNRMIQLSYYDEAIEIGGTYKLKVKEQLGVKS